MAHAAVISLKQTIERLRNSCRSSIDFPSQEILQSAYAEVKSLQKVVERWDSSSRISREKIKVLEGRMREREGWLVLLLRCLLRTQLSAFKIGQEQKKLYQEDEDIDCFTQTVEACVQELDNRLPEEGEDGDDDAAVLSGRTDFGRVNPKMVGLSDQICKIILYLSNCFASPTTSIVGMAGIGKTTLAEKVFHDPFILYKFETRIFVNVGPKSQLKEILQAILAKVTPCSDKILMEGDEKLLTEHLCKCLYGRRYLIVLDDVWHVGFWDDFKRILPEEDNGSKILVTTRLEQVAIHISRRNYHNMRFLNEEESWDLLCWKVFAEEMCPPQLEKVGKKIAENCEGLPLLILTVADLLSKDEKTLEYWNMVAENKENPIFMDAYDQISKVLYPSFKHLPPQLKACFLYMGAFPQNYGIRCSRLINLWCVEGFLEPKVPFQKIENFAIKCLRELVSCNLVMDRQRSCYSGRVKVCSLHSVFWYLCKKEAENNKFLQILNSHADCSAEGMESKRRFSIYKNILFSIKHVYNSIASISTIRSLLCTGPYHQYQVPIYFGLMLLRVLDALTIRFYDFPLEILKLVQLRYLAFTYNGDLPPSISHLWHLECLIIHQHLRIRSTLAQSYLPVEIWDLQNLKYLQIMGRNLPNPPHGVFLRKLSTLLDVGSRSCTKSVLLSIPHLQKLRVQVELAPDAPEILSCFQFRMSDHYRLESLQCAIVNPKLGFVIAAPSLPSSVFAYDGHPSKNMVKIAELSFPLRLRKLTLSGLGYPWEYMHNIANLEYLEVLKLQSYAFRGQKWELEGGFLALEYLLIEDTDLMLWKVRRRTFPKLRFLTMKNCYKLQEIPEISSLVEIKLVDCNLSAMTCAKLMMHLPCQIYATSSWNNGSLKS